MHKSEQGGSHKTWGSLGVLNWRQRSRRLYWIKHHGLAWYWSLSAALVGRYFLYLAAIVALVFGLRAGVNALMAH